MAMLRSNVAVSYMHSVRGIFSLRVYVAHRIISRCDVMSSQYASECYNRAELSSMACDIYMDGMG